MSRAGFLLPMALLTGCGHSNTSEPGVGDKISNGDVALYATAPDGTRLWAVKGRNGRVVYFASTGTETSHSEPCGKNCTRDVDDAVASTGEKF